jgi:hypothetical protein
LAKIARGFCFAVYLLGLALRGSYLTLVFTIYGPHLSGKFYILLCFWAAWVVGLFLFFKWPEIGLGIAVANLLVIFGGWLPLDDKSLMGFLYQYHSEAAVLVASLLGVVLKLSRVARYSLDTADNP